MWLVVSSLVPTVDATLQRFSHHGGPALVCAASLPDWLTQATGPVVGCLLCLLPNTAWSDPDRIRTGNRPIDSRVLYL